MMWLVRGGLCKQVAVAAVPQGELTAQDLAGVPKRKKRKRKTRRVSEADTLDAARKRFVGGK